VNHIPPQAFYKVISFVEVFLLCVQPFHLALSHVYQDALHVRFLLVKLMQNDLSRASGITLTAKTGCVGCSRRTGNSFSFKITSLKFVTGTSAVGIKYKLYVTSWFIALLCQLPVRISQKLVLPYEVLVLHLTCCSVFCLGNS
jgi:hypothetical protein